MPTLLKSAFFSLTLVMGACAQAGLARAETTEQTASRQYVDVEFSPDVEAKLALSGAPKHLRHEASVYVYARASGYALHRQGNNGFVCLLNRDSFLYGAQAFKPTCWDEEGATSYVPVMLAVGEWLARGSSAPEIQNKIDQGFNNNIFRSPTKAGVAYMIAGDLQLYPKTGALEKVLFPGHHMYYAPSITNAQLGVSNEALSEDPSLPFVFSAGAGGERLAYIISMVGHVAASSD